MAAGIGAARQGVAELKANIETLYGVAEAAGPTLIHAGCSGGQR